jgi:hypothetical protein
MKTYYMVNVLKTQYFCVHGAFMCFIYLHDLFRLILVIHRVTKSAIFLCLRT